MASSVDVLVIGAGPTGLGAAKRLNQLVSAPLPPPPSLSSGILHPLIESILIRGDTEGSQLAAGRQQLEARRAGDDRHHSRGLFVRRGRACDLLALLVL